MLFEIKRWPSTGQRMFSRANRNATIQLFIDERATVSASIKVTIFVLQSQAERETPCDEIESCIELTIWHLSTMSYGSIITEIFLRCSFYFHFKSIGWLPFSSSPWFRDHGQCQRWVRGVGDWAIQRPQWFLSLDDHSTVAMGFIIVY